MSPASAFPDRDGKFVRVDDIDMWVEEHGGGPPLFMLNGGFGMTTIMDDLIDAFKEQFTVIAFDARGHGRSSFGEGPITYAREAADAVKLMDELGYEKVHIFGHSDGGCVSLHLLFDYPHRILSSTLSGTPYCRSVYNAMAKAFVKEFPKSIARLEEDEFGLLNILRAQGLSDDKIATLADRLYRAWASTPNFTLDMLSEIDNPVLVIEAGSDEFIDKQHFSDMTNALMNAQPLELPDMTHDPNPFAEQMAKAIATLAVEMKNK